MDAEMCDAAAMTGQLEVLKWARSNGCPWNRTSCQALASLFGHSEVVAWLGSAT
ncbi:ankyrin repeat domain-containing protein [bacterium]|nr:ankyrin repeat domain-containing protein [bacterium]